MLPLYLALVSESASVSPGELTRVAAALEKQVARDFAPIWEVTATLSAFTDLEDMPTDYCPLIVMDDIGVSGAAGIHLDKNGQPFALIQYSPSWSLTASHETLELLADPFGNRLVAGPSPMEGQGRVEFLLEVCDPSEAAEFSYTVNGVMVSDFITPHYHDPAQAPGVRYSYTGAISSPREVLKGGYLSWHDPVSDHWWQVVYFGDQPEFRDLGVLGQLTGSIRSWIDAQTDVPPLQQGLALENPLVRRTATAMQRVDASSKSRAAALHAQIKELTRSRDR
jgi:hypothetical protein